VRPGGRSRIRASLAPAIVSKKIIMNALYTIEEVEDACAAAAEYAFNEGVKAGIKMEKERQENEKEGEVPK